MTILSEDDEQRLIDVSIQLDLIEQRALLISAECRAEIPTDKRPKVQLTHDLRWLARRHGERADSPLARWLHEAIKLAGTRPECDVLRAILERLPATPELAEHLLTRWRVYTRDACALSAPFISQAGDHLLDEVFVELDLDERVTDPTTTRSAGRSLEELLTRHSPGRWVILGEPGAGKTTLARHLAWRASEEPQPDAPAPLPIFISLARLVDFGGHPFDLVEHTLARREGRDRALGLADTLRKAALRPGRLWVFFDGLDEVPPKRVRSVVDDIRAWGRDWQGAAIVVLSRPAGLVELGGAFRRAHVRPLDDTQQQTLLRRWLGERADAVWAHLQSHRRLQTEARNPLLLTLVALLARHDRALPGSRVEVYGQALDLLFERGHGIDGTGVVSPDCARRAARRLARRLTEGGGEAWSRDHLVDCLLELELGSLLDPWGGDPAKLLDDLGQHAGVLAAHDGSAFPWRFLHRSLRELLTSEAIWSDAERSGRPEAHLLAMVERLQPEAVGTWGEPLAMLCGRLRDQVGFLRRLADVNLELALRAFPNIEGVDAEDAVGFLDGVLGADLDQIVDNAHRLGLDDAVVAGALLGIVRPDLSPNRLAAIYAQIHTLDGPPERGAFFGRAGRLDPPPPVDWVPIPGGRARLGRPDRAEGDPDLPPREVEVEPFEMSATPLTVDQMRRWRRDFAPDSSSDLPAGRVTWDEALVVCAWLGARLPTEDEWEHACRAGTTGRLWSGESDAEFDAIGWSLENSGGTAQPVRGKAPNPWGLYDMCGNVAEWCSDRFVPSRGAGCSPVLDGSRARGRVVRGGSFADPVACCRASARRGVDPQRPRAWIGVRPVRDG